MTEEALIVGQDVVTGSPEEVGTKIDQPVEAKAEVETKQEKYDRLKAEHEAKTFSEEEQALFGKSTDELSVEEQREQAAIVAIQRSDEREKAEQSEKERIQAAKKADEENRRSNAIGFHTQFHLCTYCGGQKTKILKGTGKQPRVVIGMEIPVPSPDGRKQPLFACYKCLGKLFNSLLGVPRFYGQEMQNLMGDLAPKGSFPIRKDTVS